MPGQKKIFFNQIDPYRISGNLFPAGDDVHVWLFPVQAAVYEGLSETEMARAKKFRQPADADRFCTARLALRRLAGIYLGIPPSEVQIAGDRHGKPYLANKISPVLHFNSSHSGSLVLIAFGRLPVGIDIEKLEREFEPDELLPEHFSEQESAAMAGAPDRLEAFYRLWTRKEALIKGKGTGLGDSLKTMPVLADNMEAGSSGEHWQLRSFVTSPGYEAALACNVSARGVVFYRASDNFFNRKTEN